MRELSELNEFNDPSEFNEFKEFKEFNGFNEFNGNPNAFNEPRLAAKLASNPLFSPTAAAAAAAANAAGIGPLLPTRPLCFDPLPISPPPAFNPRSLLCDSLRL